MSDLKHLRERTVLRKTIYSGRLLNLHEDSVTLPSGRAASRVVVEHRGAVAIVPVDQAGKYVLVRQWRHPIGGALWELPAGTLDPGEEPMACAERELGEETGYQASTWVSLGQGHVAPGYSTEMIFLFKASGLRPGPVHPDEDEILDVEAFDADQVRQLIAAKEVDLKTIAGLALAGLKIHV